MEIRAERPEDVEAVRKIEIAAFGRASEADLVEACSPSSAVGLQSERSLILRLLTRRIGDVSSDLRSASATKVVRICRM